MVLNEVDLSPVYLVAIIDVLISRVAVVIIPLTWAYIGVCMPDSNFRGRKLSFPTG